MDHEEPHAYQAPTRPAKARHLSFAAHVAGEFALGVALGASAVVLDFNPGTLVVALVIGLVLASSAVSIDVSGSHITQHKSWDHVLVALLLAATAASAIAGAGVATLVFAMATALEAGLLASTRYVSQRH